MSDNWAEAVAVAALTGAFTLPHSEYCALSEAGTEAVLDGTEVPRRGLVEWSEPNLCVANCVVTRELWDRVGGQDERFAGHDHSDVAFYYACRGLAGEQCLPGPLWHLWHPIDLTTPAVSRDMVIEYEQALKEDRMEAFLASRP